MPILMLKKKRIAFPAFAEPQAIGEGEPAYGGRLIIDPKDPDVALIDKAMLEAAVAKWKEDGKEVLDLLIDNKKVCFEHGPYKSSKTGKPYAGFEGMFNLGMRTAADKAKPTVFNKYGEPVTDKTEIQQLIYSGCYVNAKVELWAQNNSFGRRINCTVLGVMFAEDGDSFGGSSAPAKADDFADMAAPKADVEDVL